MPKMVHMVHGSLSACIDPEVKGYNTRSHGYLVLTVCIVNGRSGVSLRVKRLHIF